MTDDPDYAGYEEAAQRSCAANLSSYVGTPRTTLTGEPLTVDEPRWTAGTKQFSCHLFLGSEVFPLVGSAQGSRR